VTTYLAAAGRRWRRPAAVAVLLLGIALLGLTSGRGVWMAVAVRSPVSELLPDVPAPSERTVAGIRYVTSDKAPERLLPDTTLPREPVRLLWLQGRLAQPFGRSAVVLDEGGGVLDVNSRLHVRRLRVRLGARELVSVAAARGGLWLTTLSGDVLRVDSSGAIVDSSAFPDLGFASVASDSSGTNAVLVRSTARFAYQFDSTAPLLVRLADAGRGGVRLGRAIVPEHALLADLANSGSLAVTGDTIYYAPFIRDEIVAMRSSGDTLWIASRNLPQSTREPRFEVDSGRVVVSYHPVNLGVALGPDGRLYVLSTPGFTTTESRLDVFDPRSGHLLRSALFSTALPTIAVAADGRTFSIDPLRLLTGVAPRERESLAPITLPLLAGGQMTLDSTPGMVTLVNVWASWCVPCREEMPALDSLHHQLSDEPRFRFVTINEDVRADDAREFLAAFGFDFTVLLGGGRQRNALHYPGLPYTFLLDANGRIVQRWIGFAGPEQLAAVRSTILDELARTAATTPHHH
jgi:thiol-disulfide isomerase/thioredoxin